MTRMVNSCSFGLVFLAMLSLVSMTGCPRGDGRPKTYPVTGTVTLGGTPVDGATVIFVPKSPAQPGTQGPQAATAITDAAGKYTLGTFAKGDGAVPGEYLVKVFKFPTPPQSGGGSGGSSEDEYVPPEEGAPPPPAPKNLLPEKYANEQTSGLSFTVEAKANTFDIQLTP